MTAVPPPKFVATSKLTGTAPWFVGCIAIPNGATYKVTWTVTGPAQQDNDNAPQTTPLATFWFKDPGNNTITLTITNTQSGSDAPYIYNFPVVVTPSNNAGNITGFSMRPAAQAGPFKAIIDAGSAMGFSLAYTEMMLPCIKWDYDLDSSDPVDSECTYETNPNHTYTTPKVINGRVTLYYKLPGPCSCTGDPQGTKEFSLLVYDPNLFHAGA